MTAPPLDISQFLRQDDDSARPRIREGLHRGESPTNSTGDADVSPFRTCTPHVAAGGEGALAAHLARRSHFLNTAGKVVGTSTDIQKDYLRPADVPDPATIRTEHTLKKAVVLFGRSWSDVLKQGTLRPRDDPSLRNPDPPYDPVYLRYKSRLKAIRYDYQVQGIYNKYSVRCLEDALFAAAAANDSTEIPLCFDLLFQMYKRFLLTSPQFCENIELALWVYFCFSLVEGRLTEFEAYAGELLAMIEPEIRTCSVEANIRNFDCVPALPSGPSDKSDNRKRSGHTHAGTLPRHQIKTPVTVYTRIYSLLVSVPALVCLYFVSSSDLPGLVQRAVSTLTTTAKTKSEPIECLPVMKSSLLPKLQVALQREHKRGALAASIPPGRDVNPRWIWP